MAALAMALTSPIYGGQAVNATPPPEPPKPVPPSDPIASAPADPSERFVPLERRNFSRKKRRALRAKGLL